MVDAYGGADSLPKEFTSIRQNFIEQLKKGLDIDKPEEEPEEEPEPEPEINTQKVREYWNLIIKDFLFCSLESISNW